VTSFGTGRGPGPFVLGGVDVLTLGGVVDDLDTGVAFVGSLAGSLAGVSGFTGNGTSGCGGTPCSKTSGVVDLGVGCFGAFGITFDGVDVCYDILVSNQLSKASNFESYLCWGSRFGVTLSNWSSLRSSLGVSLSNWSSLRSSLGVSLSNWSSLRSSLGVTLSNWSSLRSSLSVSLSNWSSLRNSLSSWSRGGLGSCSSSLVLYQN